MSASILPTIGQQEEKSGPQVTAAEDRSVQAQVERVLPSMELQPAETSTAPIVEPDVRHQAPQQLSPVAENPIEIQTQHDGTDGQAQGISKPASDFGFIPTMKSMIEEFNKDRTQASVMHEEHNSGAESQRPPSEEREREQRRPGEFIPRQEHQERAVSRQIDLHGLMHQPENSPMHEDDQAENCEREVVQASGGTPTMAHPDQRSEQEVTDEHLSVPNHKDSESRHHAGEGQDDVRMSSPETAQRDPTKTTAVDRDAAVKTEDGAMVTVKSEDQDMPQRAPTSSRSVSPPASASIQSQARRHSAIDHGLSDKLDKVSPPAKRATTDSEQCAPTAKVARVKKDLGKKLPKVYPPRKPRVRPAPMEPLTMTIRTDSALSTLASAAVAIKNHQGPLSTLSVPQSPTVQVGGGTSVATADASSGSTSSTITAATSIPAVSTAVEETEATSASVSSTAAAATTTTAAATTTASVTAEPPLISGRSPFKEHLPQDAAGYRCELCPGERFGRVHDLKRHQISKHNEMTWPCDFCHRPFVRRDALLRHYSVKAARNDGVHPTLQEEDRLQEAKARAKLLS
ncbi:hypothetical protein EC968_001646 [Mortierella alpina]|nr:hypothetical protein EC968_001646 [Mortierella alpina]